MTDREFLEALGAKMGRIEAELSSVDQKLDVLLMTVSNTEDLVSEQLDVHQSRRRPM